MKACQILYDKNIRTTSTSANKNDLEWGRVYFNIDFDSLSEENQEIAKAHGDKVSETVDGRQVGFKFLFDPNNGVTAEEIEGWSVEIANKFKRQELTWAEGKTLEQLKIEFAGADQSNPFFEKMWGTYSEEEAHAVFTEDYSYYYNENDGKYYRSEELCKKRQESIQEDRNS